MPFGSWAPDDPYAGTGLEAFRQAQGLKPVTTPPEQVVPNSLPDFVAQHILRGGMDLLGTPQRAYQQGLTPEEEVPFGFGVASSMMGAMTPFAKTGSLGVAGGAATIPERGAKPFYSAVLDTVENSKTGAAPAEQWAATLRNTPGVKPEEMDWIGLNDWLKDQGGRKVGKQELADYVRDNQVELREVYKGEYRPKDLQEGKYYQELEDAAQHQFGQPYDHLTNSQQSDVRRLALARQDIYPTKFGQYQLPGGENYREMLLTLPDKPYTPEQLAELNYENWSRKGGEPRWDELTESERQRFVEVARSGQSGIAPTTFQSSHWDEPNVLAHVRFNDRNIDGKKTLFLEEIQSDWHQKGREIGYKGPGEAAAKSELNAAKNALLQHIQSANVKPELADNFINSIYRDSREFRDDALPGGNRAYFDKRINLYQPEDRAPIERYVTALAKYEGRAKGVPDAPFKTTWSELALKRMLRYAADNGYDQVAWTPGRVQAERYDLSKQVEAIVARKDGDQVNLRAVMNGVRSEDLGTHHIDKVPDIVGKDLAKKIAEQNDFQKRYEGVDLKVGGEGMLGFYDKILPAAANKLGKKYGAKVGQAYMFEGSPEKWEPWEDPAGIWRLRNRDDGYVFSETFDSPQQATDFLKEGKGHNVHVMPITPELRKTATGKGFPLFQSGVPLAPPQQRQRAPFGFNPNET